MPQNQRTIQENTDYALEQDQRRRDAAAKETARQKALAAAKKKKKDEDEVKASQPSPGLGGAALDWAKGVLGMK